MREFLFRGKAKDNSEWIEGGIVHQTDFYGKKFSKYFIIDGTDTQDYDIGENTEVIPETVCQYTGFNDKTKWEQLSEDEKEKFLSEWNYKEN